MGLTVEVLNDLEARNLQAAAQAALAENNAIALIELLEMLWSCDLEGANTVIDAVLQRLQQLREQMASWGTRSEDAQAELEQMAGQLVAAEEQSVVLAAQGEDQAGALPSLEDALRAAQNRANEQRASVAQVQQQIQVLAAEQRSIEEQSRGLNQRRERLLGDRNALAAPDEARLSGLQAQHDEAREQAELAAARLQELQDSVPQLDDERRTAQQAVNTESSRLADLSARLEALRALQDKVRTDGKLKPWLSRHGLDGLQALWSRIHVESGWENALEAALRERLGALEVSRLDMVRAFAADAPPTRLAFYNPPPAAPAAAAPTGFKPLAGLLRLNDAGQQALLADWLTGALVADSLEEALARRSELQPGQTLYVASGHAVTAHSVSFYAPDNEQAGLLARAQEIENLDKALKGQQLIAEQTRAALVRAEAACSDASQRLVSARREAAEAQNRAHELQVETLRLSQLAEQTRARSEQIGRDLAEVDAALDELQERRVTAEARFEELDMQLADSQERHAQLDDKVIEAERALDQAREQQRSLERQAQEATFALRSLQARQGELQRSLETSASQARSLADGGLLTRPMRGTGRKGALQRGTGDGFRQAFDLGRHRLKAFAIARVRHAFAPAGDPAARDANTSGGGSCSSRTRWCWARPLG